MDGIVLVFDFDKTIIDVDSDNWEHSHGYNDRRASYWGKTIQHVRRSTKLDLILASQSCSAIKSAHALGCDLRMPDANLFFIETMLEATWYKTLFLRINTNPSYDIRIVPYHDFHLSSTCASLILEDPSIFGEQ
ncbi:hypothetical protein Leryth_025165, partial [Lithospermum erythrorhizon]